MFKQAYEIARVVVVSSLRKNLIIASLLIILPLLLAAWLFEVSNPGFQSGFVLDIGGGIMTFLSVVIIGILGFEHLFWPVEQPTPWFYFCRRDSRILFPLGKFCGVSFVLAVILIVFSLLLSLLIYFTSGSFLLSSFKVAFAIWLEYSVYFSVFVFFSTFLSRLMSVGMMLPFFFVAHSLTFLKKNLNYWVAEVVFASFPDAELFDTLIESRDAYGFMLILIYSLFVSLFYITLSGMVLRHKDL
mgnify:CR=1 FL=1